MLSKKPFVLKIYLCQPDENSKEEIIYYRKILNNPDRKKFISIYVLVIDWTFEK